MRIIRYGFAGMLGAVTNLGTFSVLVYLAHVWYVAASAIAFALSVTISFLLQKFWTFQDSRTDGMHRQALLFLSVSLVNLAVNTGLVFFFVEQWRFYAILAQTLAALLVALTSYFVYRKFVFSVV